VLRLIPVMTLQQHGCVMFSAPTCQVTNVRPSRDSPHQRLVLRLMPEYQCLWFQFYRASNFYCMAIAAESSLLTATAVEATTLAALTLVSDAAAMVTAAQSAANGRPDGDDGFAVIAMR